MRDGDILLYGTGGGEPKSGLYGARVDQAAVAFEPAGQYFYYFDTATAKLYKCRTWW
ncbi:MAG: hypothetical protein K9L68_05750 [Spirochaetales bacterium]|nr:hypothetical protein [Spirochaetales bacterium]MCF7938084.1 hypothetical protein [Spirochaetales bacterium]